jgi:hypothetical protein
VRGDAVRRGHAGSPGSGGASPYQRRGFPRGLAPMALVDRSTEDFNSWELTEQGRMSRETLALIGGAKPR